MARRRTRKTSRRKSTRTRVTRIHGQSFRCVPVGGKAVARGAFKKCLLSKIKKVKITSPKQARKAFASASKKCRVLLKGAPTKRRGRRRSTGRRRVARGAGTPYNRWNLPFEGRAPARASRRMRRAGLGRYGV